MTMRQHSKFLWIPLWLLPLHHGCYMQGSAMDDIGPLFLLALLWVPVKIRSLHKKEVFVYCKSYISWNCYFAPKKSKPTDELKFREWALLIQYWYLLFINPGYHAGGGGMEGIESFGTCQGFVWVCALVAEYDWWVSLPNTFGYLFTQHTLIWVSAIYLAKKSSNQTCVVFHPKTGFYTSNFV